MTSAELIEAGANIGFAIATINAFMSKPGVNGKQIREALEKLDQTLELIAKYVESRGADKA